jgi:large repetitive protein
VDQDEMKVSTQVEFLAPGVYSVRLDVIDKDGGVGSASFESDAYVVIYDPEGGFVTGGG